MKIYAVLGLSIIVSACAKIGPPEGYNGPPLYHADEYVPKANIATPLIAIEKEEIALTVGSDKTGFIPPDRSPDRIIFESEYPIVKTDASALDALISHNHNLRIGQAIAIGADFEPRTAGFLKDPLGKPISITGKVSYRTNKALSQGISLGVTTGMVMGANSVAPINQQAAKVDLQLTPTGTAEGMTSQIVDGVFIGLIAGGIHASVANTAMTGIAQAKNFGERVGETTLLAGHVMGGASPLGAYGNMNTRIPPVYMADGVVKRILATYPIENAKLNGSTRFIFITTVGTYRGDKYEKKYPYSSGWEYRVTNLNLIGLPFGTIEKWDGKPSLEVLIQAISSADIRL